MLRLPVIEIFGPTVQGEGPEAGRPALFVRLGGCDYRCSWCDSPYAVDPVEVRAHSSWLSPADIATALAALDAGPSLVVISGGNPALHDLAPLVATLHDAGYEVDVETQGSVWREWLGTVDRLVVSPKPPSSRMATTAHRAQFERFMSEASRQQVCLALKVVVFTAADLDFAQALATELPDLDVYLSVGTDQGLGETATIRRIRDRFRWLCEAVARRPALARARVLPQLHLLAWGTGRGS